MLTLESFEEAAAKVKEVTQETKLIYSSYFSDMTGNKVYLKPENMQRTGAYKVRGAYYKISTLSDEERNKGLITASAGNHAQGVAYAAHKYGVKAVIVMPTTTPLIKVERTKSYGAEVMLHGDVYDEACAYALQLADENGYTFIHPFDDPAVATGQGTIAMEIVQELPLVDYILVPIGGGGLATGVSTLAKLLNPHIKVIGVEPAGAACMKASLEKGEVVTLPHVNTIADGTAVQTPGKNIFPYIQENLDDIITIDDDELVDDLGMKIHGFGIRSVDDSKEGVERFLKRNPTTSVVAVEDDKIVGAILCGHDGRRGCLYHVCVDEAYRMRGIGKAMVVFAMEALKTEGINNVSLIAFTKNDIGNASVSYTHLTLPTTPEV